MYRYFVSKQIVDKLCESIGEGLITVGMTDKNPGHAALRRFGTRGSWRHPRQSRSLINEQYTSKARFGAMRRAAGARTVNATAVKPSLCR